MSTLTRDHFKRNFPLPTMLHRFTKNQQKSHFFFAGGLVFPHDFRPNIIRVLPQKIQDMEASKYPSCVFFCFGKMQMKSVWHLKCMSDFRHYICEIAEKSGMVLVQDSWYMSTECMSRNNSPLEWALEINEKCGWCENFCGDAFQYHFWAVPVNCMCDLQ